MKSLDRLKNCFRDMTESTPESKEIYAEPRPKKRLLRQWAQATKEWASTTSFHGKPFDRMF